MDKVPWFTLGAPTGPAWHLIEVRGDAFLGRVTGVGRVWRSTFREMFRGLCTDLACDPFSPGASFLGFGAISRSLGEGGMFELLLECREVLKVQCELDSDVDGEMVVGRCSETGQAELAGGHLIDGNSWFDRNVLNHGSGLGCRWVLGRQHAQDNALSGLAAPQALPGSIASGQALMCDVDEPPHQAFLVRVRRHPLGVPMFIRSINRSRFLGC